MYFINVTSSPKFVLDVKMTNKKKAKVSNLPFCGLHSTTPLLVQSKSSSHLCEGITKNVNVNVTKARLMF